MNASLDKRDFMAELKEFEKHLLRSGDTTQSTAGALANFPPLVARREDACKSVVEPQGPHPVEAPRNDGDPAKNESLHKLEPGQRADFAAIEAELKQARRHTARTEPLGAKTSNALPSLTDELKSKRHGGETVVADPVHVAERATSRRSLYVMAGIVTAGLAGVGLGAAFWNDASNPSGASSINAEAEMAKPPSQVATSADIPAQQASVLNSSVNPPGDAEQPVDAVATAGGNATGHRAARRYWACEPGGGRSGASDSNPNAGRASRHADFARAQESGDRLGGPARYRASSP